MALIKRCPRSAFQTELATAVSDLCHLVAWVDECRTLSAAPDSAVCDRGEYASSWL